ncbi:MAG: hypothetical protein MUC77_20860 [Chromatiaceae bacterium]|nr:hypothetical protein [Chromatiaceae bacterium]
MSFSVRTFLLGPDDTLYRLPSAKFSRMLDDPATHRLARFAGQRVRLAEAIVEIHERTPRAVVRLIFEMLRFDEEGRLDLPAFLRQNAALAELAMGRVLAPAATPGETIVDASSRFVAQGGRWQPSPSLERNIRRAALGELSCERL